MASKALFFEPTSPFVTFATQATRGVLVNLLRIIAMNYNATPNEAFRIYFDGSGKEEKTVGFKQLLNGYICTCCNEYLTIHQKIIDKKLQKSDVNEGNMDHYVYYTLEKIMSQNDGYKHLNCLFDGLMTYGVLQFSYVFTSISNDMVSMAGTTSSRDGNFSIAETNVIRAVFQAHLKKANENICNLYTNDDERKDYRFKCDENGSCELKVEDEQQRQEQQKKTIEQEAQAYECHNDDHKH
jgi:hypothetical protein